jgi:hypothetical protein
MACLGGLFHARPVPSEVACPTPGLAHLKRPGASRVAHPNHGLSHTKWPVPLLAWPIQSGLSHLTSEAGSSVNLQPMSHSNFTPVTEGILAERMFQDIRSGHHVRAWDGAPSASTGWRRPQHDWKLRYGQDEHDNRKTIKLLYARSFQVT